MLLIFPPGKTPGKKRGLKRLNSWYLKMIWKFGILGCVYSVNSGIGKHQALNHQLVITCEGFNKELLGDWGEGIPFQVHKYFFSGKSFIKSSLKNTSFHQTTRPWPIALLFPVPFPASEKRGAGAYQKPLGFSQSSLHKKRCGPLPLRVEGLQWHHLPFLQISQFVDLLDSLHWHQPHIAWKSAGSVKRFLRFLRHWPQ